MKNSLKALREKRASLVEEAGVLAAKENLTEEEAARVTEIWNEVSRIDAQKANIEKVLDATTGDKAQRFEMDPGKPVYSRLGDQLVDVAAFAKGEATQEQINKLHAVKNAASGLSTGSPSDGGFLVQDDFSTALMERGMSAATLAPQCMSIPIGAGSDGLEAPYVDETSRATGSRWGGVQVYRRAEAETVASSKPKLGKWECSLEDLMAICYVTGRALRDATSLGAIVSQSFQEEFSFRIDDEIVRGTGAGQCQGILSAGCLVQQAKEGGQTADTVVAENIIKMYSRMPAKFRAGASWYINQEIEPQLMQMNIAVGTGGIPVYMPANGLAGTPYATLFGRPVVPIEQASALGDLGDVMFLNLSQYILITKDGIDAQQSMHVRFIYDEMCFRFIQRVNGKPKWKTALTPYKGANTLSPFVALAERA